MLKILGLLGAAFLALALFGNGGKTLREAENSTHAVFVRGGETTGDARGMISAAGQTCPSPVTFGGKRTALEFEQIAVHCGPNSFVLSMSALKKGYIARPCNNTDDICR